MLRLIGPRPTPGESPIRDALSRIFPIPSSKEPDKTEPGTTSVPPPVSGAGMGGRLINKYYLKQEWKDALINIIQSLPDLEAVTDASPLVPPGEPFLTPEQDKAASKHVRLLENRHVNNLGEALNNATAFVAETVKSVSVALTGECDNMIGRFAPMTERLAPKPEKAESYPEYKNWIQGLIRELTEERDNTIEPFAPNPEKAESYPEHQARMQKLLQRLIGDHDNMIEPLAPNPEDEVVMRVIDHLRPGPDSPSHAPDNEKYERMKQLRRDFYSSYDALGVGYEKERGALRIKGASPLEIKLCNVRFMANYLTLTIGFWKECRNEAGL